jgi:hypothetical protein
VIVIDVVPVPANEQLAHDVVTVAELEVVTRAMTLENPSEPGSETVKSGSAAFVVVFTTAVEVPEIPG